MAGGTLVELSGAGFQRGATVIVADDKVLLPVQCGDEFGDPAQIGPIAGDAFERPSACPAS